MSAAMPQPILEVKHLHTVFHTPRGPLHAVDGVSFTLDAGECLGIIGESGSGKTVTCLSIMGLIDPPGYVTAGEILFQGRDLLKLPERELEELRGKEISMIFQDPQTSLNPVFTVEMQMTDVIKRHLGCGHGEAARRAAEVLSQVGLPAPAERLRQYPFQLSGGLRQRVMIAMALSCRPSLIIADEPTTALDVSIQAQILDLLQDLKSQLQFALIFVSHDLGIIANLSDKVIIMYAGRCMEVASTEAIFAGPMHPYTEGLLGSAPSMSSTRQQPLQPIEGVLPDLTRLPPGCPFAPRCRYRTAECDVVMPPLKAHETDHLAACYHPVRHTQPHGESHG
jgi:oligopeptide/dipeptide ABC transporter ATP-binding protein